MIELLYALAGAVVSWVIAHVYYKKSERDLKTGFAEQMGMLKTSYDAQLEAVEGAKQAAAADLWDRRLTRAIEEHGRRGTSQLLIGGFIDYTPEQKADLWDAVGASVRGAEGFRANPFRE